MKLDTGIYFKLESFLDCRFDYPLSSETITQSIPIKSQFSQFLSKKKLKKNEILNQYFLYIQWRNFRAYLSFDNISEETKF
jgi:hypothetical protein